MTDALPQLDPATVQTFAANAHGDLDVVRSLFLLESGARLDLFAAAMLGDVEVVSATIRAYPSMRDELGTHGIPLIEHARAGGVEARGVLELLETTEVVS